MKIGEWKIQWQDVDYIRITGPDNQQCIVTGGDFESILSGICGVLQLITLQAQSKESKNGQRYNR